MDTIRTPRHARRATRSPRRWRIARLVLAGGTLVGVGAGMTAAAWTDGAYFHAAATSAKVELQACVKDGGGNWSCSDADDLTAVVTLPALGTMVPGQQYTTLAQLKNSGSVPLSVVTAIQSTAEPLAQTTGTAPNATIAISPATATTIPAGTSIDLTVTVTTPGNWNPVHANKSSADALVIVATGTTL